MTKLDNMVRFIPSILRPDSNPNVRGLLSAWASGDDDIVVQIGATKDQIFIKNADGSFLDLLGSNVGVFRDPNFSLTDSTFRNLIPILSYKPKQVVNTIQLVLDVFFGVGNSDVFEVNPNEVVIRIPATIPGVRELKGAFHLNSYSGDVVSIDTTFNTITVDFEDTTQVIQIDEFANSLFGQNQDNATILSNTGGTTGVILQFSTTADLTVFNTTDKFNVAVPTYQGSFLPDTTAAFTLRSLRGTLGQTITAGDSFPILQMNDASNIPDTIGNIVLSFGIGIQEGPIQYFSRPNNTTLFIDPAFVFAFSHVVDEPINVALVPYQVPKTNGADYSIYLSNITSSVTLAQQLVRSIVAAGVVIRTILT